MQPLPPVPNWKLPLGAGMTIAGIIFFTGSPPPANPLERRAQWAGTLLCVGPGLIFFFFGLRMLWRQIWKDKK